MTTTKYENLYPKEFLNYFGDNKNVISDIELQSNQYSVDIDEIIKKTWNFCKRNLFQ